MDKHHQQKLYWITEAEQQFERVSKGEDPITFGNAALTALGTVALISDIPREFPAHAARLSELIEECAPILARVLAAEIPSGEVFFAMDAAERLTSAAFHPNRSENVICVALLKLELTRLVLRGQLSKQFCDAIPLLMKTKPASAGPALAN